MGHQKKKFESGEGAQYISRATAMKRLQLTLKDFRRLCILKGIYPREPRNRKRAQKGAGGIRTLYHKKDIQFLMHEPIIWKFREIKVHARKVGRAKSVKEYGLMKKLHKSYPTMKLDHIVKERYPTFIDALRDLDDCLTLCFLFSTFPSLRYVPPEVSQLCRRLTVEFLHAIMANRALRKVFISIKGYYFQAEVRGQLITWIQPHHFGYEPQSKDEVDFRIMATFVQFYTIMLGFVNFRLYHTLNLYYPPKFANYTENSEKDMVDAESFVSERIAALNFPLSRTGSEPADEEEELQIDVFPSTDDPEKLEEAKVEAEKVRGLKTLFKGLKVFLGREVPREPLVFTLRCFGAEVSWDQHLFVGATFDVTDESVTHQIVDRPSLSQQYISRYYVQPQWVFDSVNARELLPVEKFFIGCVLPPHLSPFVDHTRDQYYVPLEATNEDAELAGKIDDAESESNEENEFGSEDDEEEKKDWANSSDEEVEKETSDESTSDEMTEERSEKRRHMKVSAGKEVVDDPLEKTRAERQEYRLREKMINKKHRNLYRSMMKGRKERLRDKYTLENKRAALEDQKKASKRKKLTISPLSDVPVTT